MFRTLSGSLSRGVFVVLALGGLCASAWAQDYTVTTAATGSYVESRPAGATLVNVSTAFSSSGRTAIVSLPFEFLYFGTTYSTAAISTDGYLVIGATAAPVSSNSHNPNASHGQDSGTKAFPYASSGDVDGLVALIWKGFYAINDGTAGCGYVYTWTTGSAPNRHFVVSWENADIDINLHTRLTLQCQLFESSGRIVFAHSAGGSSSSAFVRGLDSRVDSRFILPTGAVNGVLNFGYGANDLVIDPSVATFTGTLLYERIVSNANGIGASAPENVPLPRSRLEFRRGDGFVWAGATATLDDGSFSITARGLPASAPGSLYVLAENAGCSVSTTAGGAATAWAVEGVLSFAAGADLGTRTLSSSIDPPGIVRAAFNVARVCGAAHDWASGRTSDVIPRLATIVDASSSLATTYQPAVGTTAATLRVAARTTGNSDVWDDALVMRTFARHLAASVAGAPTTAYDDRFDGITDDQNAFADGFGYSMWAALSGSSQAIDGTSASTAVVHDLESPAITVVKGANVSGCVAGALYDLVDAANETGDVVDGTAASDHVFRAVAALSVAPTTTKFLQSWVDAGYDAVAITRAFVANKVLTDDPFEPNDARTEAASLGTAGVKRQFVVLNRFNEDWYSVTLPAAATSLAADVTYDSYATGASVGLEIRDAGGALLATGTFTALPTAGVVHAASGPVLAGTYFVGVRHVSGGTVPSYSFQAYVPLSMNATPVRDWTVGRPYDQSLGVRDGVPPYRFTTASGSMPPGLALNAETQRASGTPTQIGAFPITIELRDGGTPTNVVPRSVTVVIHDVLKIAVAPFVGFPVGRPVNTVLPIADGTPPFTPAMTSGSVPAGLSIDSSTFRVTGTAAAQGTSAFELDAVDVAGSTDHVATRGVVAVAIGGKNVAADLGAGDEACGWWFDAVKGSAVSFKAATAKGSPKRLLAGMVLAPDRSAVTTASVKAKSGSLSVTKLVCPLSGRYYVVAASAAGEAAQLLGNIAVTPPTTGKAKLADFAPTDTTTIEVGALPGATLSMKFSGDKKKQLTASVIAMFDPTGAPAALGGLVVNSGLGGTLTATLATGGTWSIVLGAQSATGVAGKVSYSYKLAQPKGVTYSAGE